MSEHSFALLIDIGNSRVKWGRGKNGSIEKGEPFSTHGNQALESFLRCRNDETPPEQIVVSNVAGARISSELQAWSERFWGLAPRFVRSQARGFGVANGYANPEKLGVDRWVALIGARHAREGAVCVADLGTAITWDVLDAGGRHLGGLIAPGVGLMRQSLARGTSDLKVAGEICRVRLARDTNAAILSGTRQAAAGLIERAFHEAARRLGDAPRLLLTGGDAPEIAAELEIPYESRPDLVLEGLYVIARFNP